MNSFRKDRAAKAPRYDVLRDDSVVGEIHRENGRWFVRDEGGVLQGVAYSLGEAKGIAELRLG